MNLNNFESYIDRIKYIYLRGAEMGYFLGEEWFERGAWKAGGL